MDRANKLLPFRSSVNSMSKGVEVVEEKKEVVGEEEEEDEVVVREEEEEDEESDNSCRAASMLWVTIAFAIACSILVEPGAGSGVGEEDGRGVMPSIGILLPSSCASSSVAPSIPSFS